MNKIARMTPQERTDIFTETADRNGLPEAVVETEPFVSSIPVDAIHRVGSTHRNSAEQRAQTQRNCVYPLFEPHCHTSVSFMTKAIAVERRSQLAATFSN